MGLAELVKREQEFAQFSREHSMKQAFLKFLSDTSLVFRPEPMIARPIYEKIPDGSSVVLEWAPEYADCAVAGDLGYTFGPWQYRQSAVSDPSAYGNYFTVWERIPAGWFIYLDLGISYNEKNDLKTKCSYPSQYNIVSRAIDMKVINDLEMVLEKSTADKGYDMAVSDAAESEVHIFRDGSRPMTLSVFQPSDPRPDAIRFVVDKAKLAQAGDMYVTYGTIVNSKNNKARASFVHVWKLTNDVWKITVDVVLTYAAEKE